MSSAIRPIQRGLQNLLANWPLLLLRLGEVLVVLTIVVVSGVVAIAVAGLGWLVTGWREMADDPARIAEWIVRHPLPLLVALVLFFLGLGVALAVHAFVFGGAAGCWIDGERAAGPEPRPSAAFARFTADRWLAHGRRTFLPVFLIYNVTWGAYGLVLLVPLGALALAILATGRSGWIVPLTCGGLLITLAVALFAGLFVHVWTGLAIVLSAAGHDLRTALADSMRVMAARPGPIIVLLVAMTAIGIASGGMVFGVKLTTGFVRESPGAGLVLLPIDLAVSFLQSVASLVASSWMVTGLVTIVEEWRPASRGSS